MIVVRFKVQCQPDKAEHVMAAFDEVIAPSRAVWCRQLDIGRDIANPDSFIATEVFEDRAALDRQESLPVVGKTIALLGESLVAEPRGDDLPRLLLRAARRLRTAKPPRP